MTSLIAQTAAAPAAAGNMYMTFAVYGLLFLGFYFLFIAPQRKKQKELEKMIASLQPGDEVLTTGGLYGTITSIKDDRFTVRIGDNTKVEIAKGFIQTAVRAADASEDKKSS